MMKYILTLIVASAFLQSCEESKLDDLQPSEESNSWLQLNDLVLDNEEGSFAPDGFSFSIGNKGYLSGGGYENQFFKEYNSETNELNSKQGVGDLRSGFASFSIGSFGYAGSGTAIAGGGNIYGLNHFEQYNPESDTWLKKANLPEVLSGAVGFSINDFGYIGVGRTDTVRFSETGELETYFYPSRSLYQYSPESNCWIKKADFPGAMRTDAVAFSIGTKAYVGTGLVFDGSKALNDFWEYDPFTNKWTRLADFPGIPRFNAVGFSIRGKGYIGTGASAVNASKYQQDFWEYDPASNIWKRIDDFPGGERAEMVSFSTESKGYLAGGTGVISHYNKDFWEFDPSR